jgi:hypothetical protein
LDGSGIVSIEALIAKYVGGIALAPAELQFLRANLSRAALEALATGPAGRNGASRRLYKLWNVLFAVKQGQPKPKPSAPQPPSMFRALRPLKPNLSAKVVSGGGVNGTGKNK